MFYSSELQNFNPEGPEEGLVYQMTCIFLCPQWGIGKNILWCIGGRISAGSDVVQNPGSDSNTLQSHPKTPIFILTNPLNTIMFRYILSSAFILSCMLSHAQTFDQCAAEFASKYKAAQSALANQKGRSQKVDSVRTALESTFNQCVIGNELPEFKLTSIGGNTYTNENVLGKVVYINLWTLGCGACMAEIPVLNNIDETYRDSKDVVFISLLLDKQEDLDKFLQHHKLVPGIDFDIVATRTPFGSTNLRNILPQPTHLFIDRNGKIAKKFEGALQDSKKQEESLKSAINELLAQ